MNKIKEEIFRSKKGIHIASFHIQKYCMLVELKHTILNKEEIQELINWLINKLDEMESHE